MTGVGVATCGPLRFDFALVGGGLQNGLIALSTFARSRARIALVEAQSTLGGNHTWCFHARDVRAEDARIVGPLVIKHWPRHEVRFPGRRRVIDGEYAATNSTRLADVLTREFAARDDCRLVCGVGARRVEAHRVVLDDGQELEATTVIDARGPSDRRHRCGYQKFVGLEIETTSPHGLAWPLLMDATIEQHDGLHFFYALPLGARRLLVEETWFSRSPKLDRDATRRSIAHYAANQGWAIESTIRDESGVLPMPWDGMPARPRTSPLIGGYAGGWFHPATGYSFPVALRRGLHAFFRQYYNLRRIDPELSELTPLEDYPVLGPDGASQSFGGLPTIPPMQFTSLLWRSPHITARDLMGANIPAALEMLAFDMDRSFARYDCMTASAYLDSLRLPLRARRMLFDVFAHSFFNFEAEMSAAELLMMMHFYFSANREGSSSTCRGVRSPPRSGSRSNAGYARMA